jgi:amino-acid N-acetyltransferase
MTEVAIDAATPRDADAIAQLLTASHLPIDGLTEHLSTAFVARQGDEIVGSAALEIYEDGALLRSVAVRPECRATGLGARLTAHALEQAAARGLPAVFLLTTTAERFFPRFGFERIGRDDVPASVQASIEFRGACPASATVMRKSLHV